MKQLNYTLALLLAFQATAALAEDTNAVTKSSWESSAALGLTLTEGNSEALKATALLLATKKWEKNELALGADGAYGEDNGEKSVAYVRGFSQYNRLFTERLYGYARVEALNDAIADIDFRLSFSPGLGYYLIKKERTTLRLEAGPGVIYEKVGGQEDTYMTLRLAERFEQKLGEKSKLWQSLEFLPQIDDWNNFLVNFEIGIETEITKNLSQVTYFQDTYDNEPAPGKKENDMKLVAAIAYKF